MTDHDESGLPPQSMGPGVNLGLTRGYLDGPDGSPTPPPPGEQFTPLTREERDQFEYLRAAFSDQVDTVRVAAMRVRHDGYERVALVAVKDVGDEILVTPLALLIDPALFEGMSPPEGNLPGPVQKDDEPKHEAHRPLVDVAYDDQGRRQSWDVGEPCFCDRPWRHAHGIAT